MKEMTSSLATLHSLGTTQQGQPGTAVSLQPLQGPFLARAAALAAAGAASGAGTGPLAKCAQLPCVFAAASAAVQTQVRSVQGPGHLSEPADACAHRWAHSQPAAAVRCSSAGAGCTRQGRAPGVPHHLRAAAAASHMVRR